MTSPPSPAPVWDVINGYAAYWALHAAVELQLFDQLGDGALTGPALAASLGVDEGSLTVLAELLVSLGLLETDGASFTASPAAQRFLISTSPATMTQLVHLSPGPHRAWPALATTLRTGHPDVATTADLDAMYPNLVRATAATQRAVAVGVARELASLGVGAPGATIVDLGCGSGVWLDELLHAAGASASGVAVDSDAVLEVARRTLADRSVTYAPGDYLDVPLPERARIVVLAHVLRAESVERAQALVHRALDLLEPGGVVVVADYFRPDSGLTSEAYRSARHDLTLSLTMRASTAGQGITERELSDHAAGRGARVVATLEPLPRQRVHLLARDNEGQR